MIGQADITAALMYIVYEIHVPRTWRHLRMLNNVAQRHRPLYPAVRHASIQIRAVARQPRGLLFRDAAKFPPNCRKVKSAGRPVAVNHRLVVGAVNGESRRLADRRGQMLEQITKALRHSVDVMRCQRTRSRSTSKLSSLFVPPKQYRRVLWPRLHRR